MRGVEVYYGPSIYYCNCQVVTSGTRKRKKLFRDGNGRNGGLKKIKREKLERRGDQDGRLGRH